MEEENKSCGSETAGFIRTLWPPEVYSPGPRGGRMKIWGSLGNRNA